MVQSAANYSAEGEYGSREESKAFCGMFAGCCGMLCGMLAPIIPHRFCL